MVRLQRTRLLQQGDAALSFYDALLTRLAIGVRWGRIWECGENDRSEDSVAMVSWRDVLFSGAGLVAQNHDALGDWAVCAAGDWESGGHANCRHRRFSDPILKKPVQWEALHTFNPAAIVRHGKVYVLYRAEDNSGAMEIGGHTSRLGLAESEDGIHFKRLPEPVFYPG